MSIQLHRSEPDAGISPDSVGVVLGSFDPPHRAHQWLAHNLLAHFDLVLLLVATSHFEKSPVPPHNATFAQRLDMLQLMSAPRVRTGLSQDALFLDLDRTLRGLFPDAEIGFAMGDGTFAKLADTPAHFERCGRVFTATDRHRLDALKENTLVFDRSGRGVAALPMPDNLRPISSTRVRSEVARCRLEACSLTVWYRRLLHLVTPAVLDTICETGLYPPSGPAMITKRSA